MMRTGNGRTVITLKDDVISRQAALNCVYGTSPNKIKGRIAELPSAQPVNIAKLQPNCNQVASDCISRQAMINEINLHVGILYDSPTLVESLKLLVWSLPPAQPGWIPVTERIPDKEGSYLCTVQGYVGKTTYLRIADFHPDIYVEYDIEEHKPGFIDYDSEYGFYEVTKVLAWQPLPTPYREGDRNDG